MKRIMAALAALLLAAAACSAAAQSTPMETFDVSDYESLGFGRAVGFTAGCREAGGARFLLVDTLGFNGHYLMTDPKGDGQWTIFSGGMPVEPGSRVTLEAEDAMDCAVRIEKDGVTQVWHFAEEPDPWRDPDWVLAGYERIAGDDELFTASFGDASAYVIRTRQGRTQTARVYYDFFRDANNLDYDKLPRSMEDALRLQEAYPVAAVSTATPGDRVNLRHGPGTGREIAGSLYSGALLTVREMKDGWAHVYAGDAGLWISAEYLVFGSDIEQVRDDTIRARLRGEEHGAYVEVSRMPYQGGGGTVTQMPGGSEVRIIGEYNREWRIVGDVYGSVYVRAQDLR
ncbi:MAG: SH3 domain-containing protein [Clostridia bacterium]|nr:SH3 domain-containing protein [Clostridia bacterium]